MKNLKFKGLIINFISLILFGSFGIAMNESIESMEYRFLSSIAGNTNHQDVNDSIRYWLSKGVDPNTPHIDNYGQPALCRLAIQGNLEGVKLLVEAGAKIESRTYVDGAWGLNYLPQKGYTALHLAAVDGYLDIVKFLLEQKDVDINVRTYSGAASTPLGLAIFWKQDNVARFLIEHGAKE